MNTIKEKLEAFIWYHQTEMQMAREKQVIIGRFKFIRKTK